MKTAEHTEKATKNTKREKNLSELCAFLASSVVKKINETTVPIVIGTQRIHREPSVTSVKTLSSLWLKQKIKYEN